MLIALIAAAHAGYVTGPLRIPEVENADVIPRETLHIAQWPAAEAMVGCGRGQVVPEALGLTFAVIEISPDSLSFAGRKVLPLEGGELADEQVAGTRIPLLGDALERARRDTDRVRDTCGIELQGPGKRRVLLAVDAGTPYRTLRAVQTTAEAAGFGDFAFLVDDREPGDWWAEPPAVEGTPLNLAVVVEEAGLRVTASKPELAEWRDLPCPVQAPCLDGPDWRALRTTLDDVREGYPDDAYGFLVPASSTPAGTVIEGLDVLRAYFDVPVIAGSLRGDGPAEGAPVSWSRGEALQVVLNEGIPALVSVLPSVGPAVSTAEGNPIVDRPVILGGMTMTALEEQMALAMPKIRSCYAESEGGEGQLELKLLIDGEGQVQQARIRRDTLGDAEVRACVEDAAKGLRFPQSGVLVAVVYPLTFPLPPEG